MGVEEAPFGGRIVKQPGEGNESGIGQQFGEAIRRPAVGRCHLVVEPDRLWSVGPEEGDQEQATRRQDAYLLGEQLRQFPGGVWIVE